MSNPLHGDDFFEQLSSRTPVERIAAPARLKAKVYSALAKRQAASGPLLSVGQTKAEGRDLCVFEELARIAPVGEKAKSLNFCRVCHARILAESLERPPIYWRHCPYVDFKKR